MLLALNRKMHTHFIVILYTELTLCANNDAFRVLLGGKHAHLLEPVLQCK